MFQVRSTSKTAARIVGAVAAGIGLLLPLGAEPPDLVCGTQLPLPPAGLYRLSSATAAPGEEVRLSFYATPDYETGSVCATVDFDEGSFRSVRRAGLRRDKSEWGSRYFDFSNEDATPATRGCARRASWSWREPCSRASTSEASSTGPRFPGRRCGDRDRGHPVPRASGRPAGRDAGPLSGQRPDRRPSSSNDWKNALGFPDGGLHTVDVIHGSITIEGLRWRLRRCGATASAG